MQSAAGSKVFCGLNLNTTADSGSIESMRSEDRGLAKISRKDF
jgi:hypothetical protein